jgi:hypothetical protein
MRMRYATSMRCCSTHAGCVQAAHCERAACSMHRCNRPYTYIRVHQLQLNYSIQLTKAAITKGSTRSGSVTRHATLCRLQLLLLTLQGLLHAQTILSVRTAARTLRMCDMQQSLTFSD